MPANDTSTNDRARRIEISLRAEEAEAILRVADHVANSLAAAKCMSDRARTRLRALKRAARKLRAAGAEITRKDR